MRSEGQPVTFFLREMSQLESTGKYSHQVDRFGRFCCEKESGWRPGNEARCKWHKCRTYNHDSSLSRSRGHRQFLDPGCRELDHSLDRASVYGLYLHCSPPPPLPSLPHSHLFSASEKHPRSFFDQICVFLLSFCKRAPIRMGHVG